MRNCFFIKNPVRRFIYTSLTIVFFLIIGCHKKEVLKNKENYRLLGDTIFLPKDSNIKDKIRLSTIKEEPFRMEINTVGAVKAIPNAYAEITPPFSGKILKSFVKLGQSLEPGTPIFEISSSGYSESIKNYLDAKQGLKQAELNLKRQKKLLQFEVGIQQDLEQTQTDLEISRSAFYNAESALKVFNINPETAKLGSGLIVRSPIKGTVVENNIVIGQYLKEDSGPIVIVAELSKVWVTGQIKEKDIPYIKELGGAEIKISSLPRENIKGTIYHIKDLVDEATRSVEVLVSCDNKDRNLRPGMFVTVRFMDVPTPSILIPEKAVLQSDENAFVFVQTEKDHYIKRTIELENTYNGKILVKSGLKNGEVIISDGGIYLMTAK